MSLVNYLLFLLHPSSSETSHIFSSHHFTNTAGGSLLYFLLVDVNAARDNVIELERKETFQLPTLSLINVSSFK